MWILEHALVRQQAKIDDLLSKGFEPFSVVDSKKDGHRVYFKKQQLSEEENTYTTESGLTLSTQYFIPESRSIGVRMQTEPSVPQDQIEAKDEEDDFDPLDIEEVKKREYRIVDEVPIQTAQATPHQDDVVKRIKERFGSITRQPITDTGLLTVQAGNYIFDINPDGTYDSRKTNARTGSLDSGE